MECSNCKSRRFYQTKVDSKGGYGPNLLPGTGFFSGAKFKLQICEKCGFVHWFIADGDLEKVKKSKKFKLEYQ